MPVCAYTKDVVVFLIFVGWILAFVSCRIVKMNKDVVIPFIPVEFSFLEQLEFMLVVMCCFIQSNQETAELGRFDHLPV